LLLCRLMRAVMPPFGFVGEGFLDCGQTAEFEAEFSGCEAFTAYLVLVLREVDDFVAMAAGAVPRLASSRIAPRPHLHRWRAAL
jgi:hypothetical protein